jgi:DNA-binding transcriptional regulator YiaG
MKCPNCAQKMVRKGHSHVTKVGGFTVTDGTAMVPVCEACGARSLTVAELAGYERRAAWQILTSSKTVSGEVLKFARKALGLRQKDFARLLGFSETHLSRLENDDAVEVQLRLAVAQLLDIAERHGLPSVEDVATHPEQALEVQKRVA